MDESEPMIGEPIDDEARFTLEQLCELCGVSSETVLEFVAHGVLEPQGQRPQSWRFSNRMLIRSRKAHRLRRDLDLNLPGVALCLELLEELETLRRQLSALGRRELITRARLDE